MTAEDKIQNAFRDLDERTGWIDATRNQAPSAKAQGPRNQPKMPRRPMMALAAAVLVLGGGAVAINTLTDDAQTVETGPTESTETDGTATTIPADDNDDSNSTDNDDSDSNSSDSDDSNSSDSDDNGQTFTSENAVGFTSPSGNIACNLSTESASCWIGEKEWEIEQPTDDPFCAESDWGNAIDVNTDGPYWPCYTDFSWPIDAEPLAYGDRMRVGDFECSSAEEGVTCTNAVGQGFRVARSVAVTFPDPQPADPIWAHRTAVATSLVEADDADPFLNVRETASPDGALVAKLPPEYTGMVATGRTESLAGGAVWMEVLLVDPLEQAVVSPSGGYPNGWVNAALTVELAGGASVTTDQLPACSRDGASTEPGSGTGAFVYSLEHTRLSDSCDRLVVSFGAGEVPILGFESGSVSRSAEMPVVVVGGAGDPTGPVTIDLGPISDAWTGATDNRSGVYLVRGKDDYLDVMTSFPVEDVIVTTLADRVVIDLVSPGDAEPKGRSVAALAAPAVGDGSVSIIGVARPFEATLDISIEDASGEPVEAMFNGSGPLGSRRTTNYGLGTTDWVSAWGYFELTIEDLDSGEYTVVLDAGLEDPAHVVRYEVTIP